MKKTIHSIISAVFLVSLVFVPYSFAQVSEPEGDVIITWQANNYIPSGFEKKSLPAPYTKVEVSAELVLNNKLADISGADIKWFINDEFYKSGKGLKTITFYTSQEEDEFTSVRVSIITPAGRFDKSLQIPLVQPEIVLSYKSPVNTVQENSRVTFDAIPYSFSIRSLDDLKFYLMVNGEYVNTRGGRLILNIGSPQSSSQKSIEVFVSAQNNTNSLEVTKTMLVLPLQGL